MYTHMLHICSEEAMMNLRTAESELRGRTPRVTGRVLALEVVVVVSVAVLLVKLFG